MRTVSIGTIGRSGKSRVYGTGSSSVSITRQARGVPLMPEIAPTRFGVLFCSSGSGRSSPHGCGTSGASQMSDKTRAGMGAHRPELLILAHWHHSSSASQRDGHCRVRRGQALCMVHKLSRSSLRVAACGRKRRSRESRCRRGFPGEPSGLQDASSLAHRRHSKLVRCRALAARCCRHGVHRWRRLVIAAIISG